MTGSHMDGQGRPASFSQVAKERAAASRGWGCPEPCQQETWLGPARRSHAPAPRPAGEVGTWESRQKGRNQGVSFPSSLSFHYLPRPFPPTVILKEQMPRSEPQFSHLCNRSHTCSSNLCLRQGSPGWPGTCYVAKDDRVLLILRPSLPQVQGSQAGTTTLSLHRMRVKRLCVC